jgi:single-strand DNA-binding protein
MASFNKVILMGRLCADPELKQTQSGVAATSFTIAVDRRVNKQCDFITVVAWRQTAEFICRYFKKGQAILVCGELQTRSWTDNNGNKRSATEVVAAEATFCEAKKETEGNNTPAKQNGSPAYIPDAYKQAKFDEIKDDADLPF